MKWEHFVIGFGITLFCFCAYKWPLRTIFGGGIIAVIILHWIGG